MKPWAQVKARHSNTRESCTIAMAAELANEYDRLQEDLPGVRESDEQEGTETVPAILARLREVAEALAASQVTFTFAGMGRQAFRRLQAKYPPTEAQLAEVEGKSDNGRPIVLTYDIDEFPPALFAACCVSIVDLADGEQVDPAGVDWAEVWNDWSGGQTRRLWDTVLLANSGVAEAPKSGAAYARMNGSAKS